MEDLLIPGWAVFIILGMIAWLVWLTRETYQNQKSIAINTNNDEKVSKELEKIYKAIEKLEGKIDLYFHQRFQQ
jgi:predicted negative regulator of RcsB-dependent stress response